MESSGFTYELVRARHAERLASSMAAHGARLRGRTSAAGAHRLRPERHALSALAIWIVARRRPGGTVARPLPR